ANPAPNPDLVSFFSVNVYFFICLYFIFYWFSCCSPLIISVCIKICYGSFHKFKFYFLAVQLLLAINHSLLYQNLLCLFYLLFIKKRSKIIILNDTILQIH
ncbi:MAG: hypothetical protein CVU01_04355, partial [Bacteroidetes bacterium HGW-Bacteroidetes-18]